MANGDENINPGGTEKTNQNLQETKKLVEATKEEIIALDDAFVSIGSKIGTQVNSQLEGATDAVREVAGTFNKDLEGAIKNTANSLNKNSDILNKIQKGKNVEVEINRAIEKAEQNKEVILRKAELLKRNGIDIDEEDLALLQESIQANIVQLNNLKDQNTENQKAKGLFKILSDNAGDYANKIDKSGTLAKLMKGDIEDTLTLQRAQEAAMLALVNAMFSASDNINAIQKATGISYESARKMQLEFANAATNSGKLFINSKELNKAFGELAEQSGIVADFGAETLVTQTTLTKQLGLSAGAAGQLSMMARMTGTNTEEILDNTVNTVSALSSANGVGINVKNVLDDVSTASKAIVVSLGQSPEILAEAATEARLLGSNLAEVDAIAGSLLNFEESISNELEFELLTGKQINLEKARLYALNNDIAGLSREIAENSEITEAFATGNRVQQEAAAQALGMGREELGNMVYQQQLLTLGAEGFKDQFGEATYQSLQAQSASEKFQETITKIQGILGDIGTIIAPIVDAFASVVGYLAESKVFATGLVGVLTTLAVKSLVTSIATIYKSFAEAPFGVGIPFAIAATSGLIATIAAATSLYGDDVAYGDNKLVMKDKGTINLNNDDTIIAGTNLFGKADDAIVNAPAGALSTTPSIDYDKMAAAVSKINVTPTIKYNSFKEANTSAFNGSYQSEARYSSKFS